MSFEGRTILVTGAAGNLGAAVAEAFHAAKAHVVLVDLTREALDSRFPGGDGQYTKVAVDLLDQSAVTKAVGAVAADRGGIDALCAIAGGFHMGEPVHDTPRESWDLMHDMNVRTLLHTCRAVVPHMVDRGSGKIVTIGANAAMKGVPGMGAYCAAKSTVMRLTESMSGELREKGINVNSVLPSIIDTPVNRADMPDVDPDLWVAPSDLAEVIMFLCSNRASAIHGALIPVVGLS